MDPGDIAGYRIRETLAEDEVCVVLRAVRSIDELPVLLKRPRSRPPGAIETARLRREREVLAHLVGPGVPRLLSGETDLLVLEDAGGRPLSHLLGRRPLSAARFQSVASALAGLLGRVHEAGFIHRGLRAGTLLVDPVTFDPQVLDWGAASRLTEDAASAAAGAPVNLLQCLSPEQTGRMNRGVDHRTDFYALGAIFYELLTGRAPFETRDLLELVHWQIARTPLDPTALNPSAPPWAARITMKLLAKMAEDRYQSAAGLLADLARFASSDGAATVSLGDDDSVEHFTPPQRLYGRDRELAALDDAFARAASGETNIVFLYGQAGVGKTAVVAELGKSVAARGGHFVSGKFDQLVRSVPYAALTQALGALARDLGATRPDLSAVLQSALGSNAGVLTALVPELSVSMGAAASPPSLGPTETQNRLSWALQTFLATVATREAPLVVFLDDLQWADMATLRLLAATLGRGAPSSTLWVGAFRDSEVSIDHPLSRFRQDLRERGLPVQEVPLPLLRQAHLAEFLHDAFSAQEGEMKELARLLQEKTDGNPYFVIQFLTSLEQQQLLSFDRGSRRWRCDLKQVERAGMTDNVVELMARKLRHLPPATRAAVAAAAYIGNTFSLETLALARQQPPAEVAAELWEAIAEGLVRPTSAQYEVLVASESLDGAAIEYRFSHDRVQQSAHALVPEAERADLHLRVARLLWRTHGDAPDRLFDLVGHFNRALDLVPDPDERRRLAVLNRSAGRRARAAGALQQALALFRVGGSLAPIEEGSDELSWTLALEAAECQLASGESEEADRTLAEIADRAPAAGLVAEALRIRIVHLEDKGRFAESARLGFDALARFQVVFPGDPDARSARLERDLAWIEARLAGRSIASLADLPRMTDPAAKRIATLIVAMWPSAFLTNEAGSTALLSAHLVRLALERGNTEEAAIGYLTHAITVNARTHDYRKGNELGRLGLAVNEQFGDVRLRAKVHHLFGSFLAAWGQPLAEVGRHGREAHQAAIETGDYTYAGRAAFMETWSEFFAGRPLARFGAQIDSVIAFLDRIGHQAIRQAAEILLQWTRALRGETPSRTLSGPGFDEEAFAAKFQQVPIFLGFLGVAQTGLAYVFDDHRRAWEIGRRTAHAFGSSAEQIWHSACDFYLGLAAASLLAEEPEAARVAEETAARLRARSQGCACNFEHQHLLIEAERARVQRAPEAADLYTRAVAAAERSGFPNDRALVHERLGRFEAERGQLAAARGSLSTAASLYREWGASAKVHDLDGQIRALSPDAAEPPGQPLSSFDAASALKAAQAIAAEIDPERLLPRLVRIVIENVGAERGVLLEASADGLVVVAEGTVSDAGPVGLRAPLDTYAELPTSLVRQVHATATAVVVGDARTVTDHGRDPYLARRQPRSILCVPIARQGVVSGVLYLENTVTADVFTVARAETVQVLASQAAISLENARVYQAMKEEVRRRTEAEAALTRALTDLQLLKDRLQAENVYLQEEIRTQHNFEEIVGNSPELVETLRWVEKVAATESTVLVLGETGTGKELVARAIHHRSGRRDRPLVKVNCAAIPTGLVESELFGHAKGPSRGPCKSGWAASSWPTAGPSFSTSWPSCRSTPRRSCCASSRRKSSSRWAAARPSGWTCGSSPRRTATSSRW